MCSFVQNGFLVTGMGRYALLIPHCLPNSSLYENGKQYFPSKGVETLWGSQSTLQQVVKIIPDQTNQVKVYLKGKL